MAPATDTMSEDSNDDVDRVERMSSGVTLDGKLKCGSNTRDEAKVWIKAKGVNAEDAIADFQEALEAAQEGEWGHELLQLNPERQEGDGDE